jgi:Domain of unknown function (DUF4091)
MRRLLLLIICGLFLTCAGCPDTPPQSGGKLPQGPAAVQSVNLSDSNNPVARDEPITLAAAQNEWTSFTLQVSNLPNGDRRWLRIHPLQWEKGDGAIPLSSLSASQIVSMPIDLNRAGYVRQTGLSTARRDLPRALLPCTISPDGALPMEQMRDPANTIVDPAHPGGRSILGPTSGPVLLWFDLHVPPGTPAGNYSTRIDLLSAGQTDPSSYVTVNLTVYDFALPDERHLQMVGEIDWSRLEAIYPEEFQAVTAALVSRQDPEHVYGETVKRLDQLMCLAEAHRVEVVYPQLQPTVKWPAAAPPDFDWGEFDPLVAPWLKGTMFPDHQPLKFWPLPKDIMVDRYPRKDQLDYWDAVATHFDENDWLGSAPVPADATVPGRVNQSDSLEQSVAAAQVLNVHNRVRVMVPLEDDQADINGDGNHPDLIDPSTTSRLMTVSPGLVFPTPAGRWPTGMKAPDHWLRTDQPELVPYVGAGGDEQDVRVWAWLAFLRNAHLIIWNSALPTVTEPADPGDPTELVWFYPGEWFGLDHPVPSIQLKWLRRAQEDYEYLWLARQRGEVIHALQMARLITKPVQIATGQYPDPIYAMMSGTSDPGVWPIALQLVAQSILLHPQDTLTDPAAEQEAQRALYLKTLEWQEPQERPMLVGRTADWSVDSWQKDGSVDKLKLTLGLDIYNASENTPSDNQLQWLSLPPGWQVTPQPVAVPKLQTYSIHRATIDGQFDTAKIGPATVQSSLVAFEDGFTKVQSPIHVVAPVAASDRHEGFMRFDGKLDGWTDADALQDGPLVQMLARPALQRQELRLASTPTRIYSSWASENFYLAFGVAGIEEEGQTHKNTVDYPERRAWGEDLCEVLIQPVYANNSVGDLLHIVVKPNGAQWVERKLWMAGPDDAWEPLNGTGIKYAANTPGDGKWTGELAIPWSLIGEQGRGRPVLLRFNFTQHKNATGESATWAGPVDFGRDSAFMGALVIRTFDPAFLGVNGPHQTSKNWDW